MTSSQGRVGTGTDGDTAAPALGFCPRCGDVVGLIHSRPECDARYDAKYRAAAVPSPAGADTETGADEQCSAFRQPDDSSVLVRCGLLVEHIGSHVSLNGRYWWRSDELLHDALSAVPVRDADGGLRGRVEALCDEATTGERTQHTGYVLVSDLLAALEDER